MYKKRTVIGIIPARSGSKGLPHKNIRDFMGSPLIAWTIRAALGSGVLDEVFVSTDSEKYAEIARRHGASVPFLRPAELAGDDSPASAYVLHAISAYRDRLGRAFDYFALLQPTSPFRTPEHIREGVELAVDGGHDSVVAFSPLEYDARLVHRLPADMSLGALASPNDTLRQGGGLMYRVNGLLYVSRCGAYERTRSFYGAGGRAYITDSRHAVDIDDEEDFLYAEFLAQRGHFWGGRTASLSKG